MPWLLLILLEILEIQRNTIHLIEDLYTKGPNKACDLATQSVDDSHKWHLFCFHEGKRAKNFSESKIRALENQAQGYCKEFIESHGGVSLVYANTFVGGFVRFWSFIRGDLRLRGFWSGDEKDHFEHYRDVGLDEHFHEIQRALDSMKSMPSGPLRRGQNYSQTGASSQGKLLVTFPVSMSSASSSQATAATSNTYPTASPHSMGSVHSLRDEDYVNVTLV